MTEQNQLAIQNQSNSFAIMPVISVQSALQRYQDQKTFIKSALNEGVDFGAIPGTSKNTLLKPGAEKLAWFFGLRPIFKDVEHVEDWSGKDHNGEMFFYYRVQCSLYKDGQIVVSADGSCNSWEKKYRYRWVQENDIPTGMNKANLKTKGGKISEFAFAIEKAETGGQYGKPAEYWKRFNDAIANRSATATKRKTKTGKEMDAWEIDSTLYCVPNDDVSEQVNTILKMAQKRALVAAVLIGANASEWFTQDMEDFIDGNFVDADAAPVHTQPAQNKAPAQQAASRTMGATQTEPPPSDDDNPFDHPETWNDPFPPAVAKQPAPDDGTIPNDVAAAMKIKLGKQTIGEMSLDELAAIIEDDKKPQSLRNFVKLVLDFKTA